MQALKKNPVEGGSVLVVFVIVATSWKNLDWWLVVLFRSFILGFGILRIPSQKISFNGPRLTVDRLALLLTPTLEDWHRRALVLHYVLFLFIFISLNG